MELEALTEVALKKLTPRHTHLYVYNSVEFVFVCLLPSFSGDRLWTKCSLTLTDYGVSLGK